MSYLLLASAGVGAVLLFLLAASTANTPQLGQHYPLLVVLTAGLAVVLAALVIVQLVRLAAQRRRKAFGSLLTFRVLVMFALMAVVPGAIVYTVSVQFLGRSIESWFDVRVDQALEGGINLGHAALDAMLNDMMVKAGLMSADLGEMPPPQRAFLLGRMREQVGVETALLVTAGGKLLARSAKGAAASQVSPPTTVVLRQARQNMRYAVIESQTDRRLLMRVVVPVGPPSQGDDQLFLQLTQQVPQSLVEAGENVRTVYDAYKELQLSRQGLKQIYILTLTLTLLLALFSAVALAFLLSRRLSQPLADLAEGTQAVARGDFSARAPVTSRDELGILTQSFNSMTAQLEEARRATEDHRAQIETANAYLESILANLSAGVLVFDRDLVLRIANVGANGILHEDVSRMVGLRTEEWPHLREFAVALREEFGKHESDVWQKEVELIELGATVLLRGSPLPTTGSEGYVLVFDDITQLIAAQRATAWGEVARRLAHEIKNPLTPIQLAAERLQAKLSSRLPAEDAQALDRATGTIVTQVTALKNMVDEFREYARTPAPRLEPLDLNALLRDVLALYEQSVARIDLQLDPQLPEIRGDRNQLRQIIHNLLQNSQDALSGESEPRIEVVTERAGGKAWLRISDNGCGFPEAIIKRAFEPYVTTKSKGTGLGLAIVRKIVDEHHGSISIENLPSRGASVKIALPLAKAA